MSLGSGQVYSGGQVRDADGRRVVVFDPPVGTQERSGGQKRDADGRTVVVVEVGV